MKRPRRIHESEVPDPLTMSFSKALEFERDRWPDLNTRWQFWSRPDIPGKFQNGSEPDPRPLLTASADEVAQWKERHRQWREGRRRWLEEAAQ